MAKSAAFELNARLFQEPGMVTFRSCKMINQVPSTPSTRQEHVVNSFKRNGGFQQLPSQPLIKPSPKRGDKFLCPMLHLHVPLLVHSTAVGTFVCMVLVLVAEPLDNFDTPL